MCYIAEYLYSSILQQWLGWCGESFSCEVWFMQIYIHSNKFFFYVAHFVYVRDLVSQIMNIHNLSPCVFSLKE